MKLSLVKIAIKTALDRKMTLTLLIISVAISVLLLIGIKQINAQLRRSFVQSVSGTDLIVGAKGSGIELILYSVFHLGKASYSMNYRQALEITNYADVNWAIPISLGDTHQNYPVVATNDKYFSIYKYKLAKGRIFNDIFEVVIGSQAAHRLNYNLGDKIILMHGKKLGMAHDDRPFTVVGVLDTTGKPTDDSLFINLESMTALHLDMGDGAIDLNNIKKFDLRPKTITALLLGLKSKSRIFSLKRKIDESNIELQALLPGVVLDELWQMVNVGERSLIFISIFVMIAGLLGMVSSIFAAINQRRRELAIYRSLGATPIDLLALVALEGIIIMAMGLILGMALLGFIFIFLKNWIMDNYGLYLQFNLDDTSFTMILTILVIGILASLIPAYVAYRMDLSSELNR
jgi:putative ABC transport system permease protein